MPRQKEYPRAIPSSQLHNVVTISDSSDSAVSMAGKRAVAHKGKGKANSSAQGLIPEVYQDMLAEALPAQHDISERPLKRRRKFQQNPISSPGTVRQPINLDSQDEEEDVQFEDVLDSDKLDDPEFTPKQLQTTYRDSEDESEESEFEWEGVNLDTHRRDDGPSGDLELTLAARSPPQRPTSASKRRIVTKEEKAIRLQIHKLHILCLLSYVDRRNRWCSDSDIQELLKPLISKKVVTLLRPKASLSQFGRAESLKRGLDDLSRLWRTRFSITARGMRRSLWAENENDVRQVCFLKALFFQYRY